VTKIAVRGGRKTRMLDGRRVWYPIHKESTYPCSRSHGRHTVQIMHYVYLSLTTGHTAITWFHIALEIVLVYEEDIVGQFVNFNYTSYYIHHIVVEFRLIHWL
jgi:hypothetical protein